MDDRRTEIVPYRDGPLVIRGDFALRDQEGREIDTGRRTVALCRCGRSRLRPFCDGSHRLAGYRAEGGLSAEAARRHALLSGNGERGLEGRPAGLPGVQQPLAEPGLELEQRAGSEEDVGGQLGL